jgi:hypothetical protein
MERNQFMETHILRHPRQWWEHDNNCTILSLRCKILHLLEQCSITLLIGERLLPVVGWHTELPAKLSFVDGTEILSHRGAYRD